MTTAVRRSRAQVASGGPGAAGRRDPVGTLAVDRLVVALAGLAVLGSTAGLLTGGGSGRHPATTARGAEVVLFGDGLYAADTWLVGAGNRGQDLAMLLVEVPVLLLALVGYRRRRSPLSAVVLAGMLSFFSYYYVSQVFATAQNRLFPGYVAAASLACFALVLVARGIDVERGAAHVPGRPGRLALEVYLGLVAAALGAAWLPGMIGTAVSGRVADAVGPYTSAATEALDLGLVVPVVLLTTVLLHREHPAGRLLALVVLVLNACIGVVLLAQGAAQVWYDVPLTAADLVARSATFLMLTAVAGAMLARAARSAHTARSAQTARSVRTAPAPGTGETAPAGGTTAGR